MGFNSGFKGLNTDGISVAGIFFSLLTTRRVMIITLLESGGSFVYILSSFIRLFICLSLVPHLCTFYSVLSDYYFAEVWCSLCVRFIPY